MSWKSIGVLSACTTQLGAKLHAQEPVEDLHSAVLLEELVSFLGIAKQQNSLLHDTLPEAAVLPVMFISARNIHEECVELLIMAALLCSIPHGKNCFNSLVIIPVHTCNF